jgi:hypothetical protein
MTAALTRRERRLYSAISALTAVAWIGALLGYFVLSDRSHHATLSEICLFAVNTVLMLGFGYALRNNLRVIRGIPWLEEESSVSEQK